MIRVVVISIVVTFLMAFGAIALATAAKGHRAGRTVALVLLVFAIAGGAGAWRIYSDTRAGGLSPHDFYNSVAGNALVVGGLVAALGAILGVVAAIYAILRRP